MAKSSSTNDLIQIVMLTFFLCSLFFAGWGGYIWWTIDDYETVRLREDRSRIELEKLLKDPKTIEIEQQYEKKKESEQQESLEAAVDNVIAALGDRAWVSSAAPPRTKSMPGGLVEKTYVVDFDERPLRDYVNFFSMLERTKPHVMVFDCKLTQKRGKRDEGATDAYSGKITFLSYERS